MDLELTKLKVMILGDGRSATQIAASAGIHPSTLSEYALGKRAYRQKDLQKLCVEFGVEPDAIVGWFQFSFED
jgi:transcriptional regulator with XRE-family HTH domain